MPRFFISPLTGTQATLTGEDARHISRSLRMHPGEALTLCDGMGHDYQGEITEVTPDIVSVHILSAANNQTEPSVHVTLYQGIPKSTKMDFIVQKAVELGVFRVVPTLTSRCVSRPDGKTSAKKVQRWQKIACEAAKQSGRGILPEVAPCISLQQAVCTAPGKCLLFYEGGGVSLTDAVNRVDSEISIFIGPEGGFSTEEVRLVQDAGGQAATLGPRILRTETAPLAALTAVMLLTGNM
ncbi:MULTISPECIES: 16S rRNA (uracil(1498)-N(3))-methyltransferase [Caproicibacterium]|jgi:16S rRNA (uracil1498-N3)-methyltransferase|uniref:Ribosomal RNA small subunit methyltransferase E n=1 Tax=Caproicibacterium lactatifermentans TaxID=2666138 RepID=A0A859DNB4_9FIRM|nr:16S rRNA (uracil(1498)-N(3))-methyltransferase [Caproicibacterium lactatifermentans]ARP51044.1 16S rRNA (uracil(1498)-N(3))-methyltransferase [Ruminococcaceae bacterium CPB6]MDD4807392.1 16S rRNA (uracil(1498)-N(3))-methyltransferase [Oscillospiraceae bacterium]QKN23230.1 16S rRNA (uracil(1498)-N(3))-methyltransferase [Caproicibacterium lactatifermentans]QKO30088.1 16S rRNA (uracil(1498)-N(3))-methyltransferase [Caproicibacterium lactatifermentans]